ncbi:MAG: hypothetical protein ABI921_07905 [Panacibacter sp.]
MREIFTDKNFIDGKILVAIKIIFIAALVIFFLPLLVLPFFNHACTDDYFCGAHLNELGFSKYQQYIYTECGGRFAATYIGSLFAENNFLYTHYYLHSLLLLLFNLLSVSFLFSVVNKYLLKDSGIKKLVAVLSLVYVALTVCSYPEPSTFLFWFSSAITYHLPVTLVQIELALLVIIYHTEKKYIRYTCGLLVALLVFFINGFNELFIVVQILLLATLFYFQFYKKISKAYLGLLIILFLCSAIIVIAAPGNQVRAERIVPKGLLIGAVAIAYHAAETLFSICKNPFFWLAIALLFISGNKLKENIGTSSWFKRLTIKKWLIPLIIIGFLFGAVAVAVTGLKGGIIPDRYLNGVAYFVVLLLLVYAFIGGAVLPLNLRSISLSAQRNHIVIYSLLTAALLCNDYILTSYKSIISAPLYSNIISERENIFKEAAQNKSPAMVKDYTIALQEHLQKDYAQSTKTVYETVQQKPSMLFFEDDLATDNSINILKQFYKLDSISVIRK